MANTVREWIEEQAANALDAFETQHGRHFSEGTKEPYFNELVNECVDGWEGTDDPLDDENEWWRDHTIKLSGRAGRKDCGASFHVRG